jgi:hypothetical protein
MQLDIFEHSRDVMLRNDALQALQRRDPVAARAAWQALATECPRDPNLPSLDVLVAVLEPVDSAPFEHPAAAQAVLQHLQDTVQAEARRQLGDTDGSAWMAPLWRHAAQRAARLAFRPDCGDAHAAALWLRAGDFAAAADAVARIESWRRIPAPLAWMAEARYRLDGLDTHWGLLAELAWLAPERFDVLTKRLGDPVLQRLRRRFDTEFDAGPDALPGAADLAWFPAWVLTEQPALAARLSQVQAGLQGAPERAMHVLLNLLHLERQGRQRDLIELRKSLRDLQPALFAAYMRNR